MIIYVPAALDDLVPSAIGAGEWYGSPIAAASVADQFEHMYPGSGYKVFKVTIEEFSE